MTFVRTMYDLAKRANQRYYQSFGDHTGTDVVKEDWDTLVILDGCRYDLFAETYDCGGMLEKRVSHGTESSEFIEKNFQGRELHDTVYVTANPYARLLSEDVFYRIVNLLEDSWDPEYRTVLPETMTETVCEVLDEHPDKRVIAHYMQPHYPFIGDFGSQLDHKGIAPGQGASDNGEAVWVRLQRGDLSRESVWNAYRENLELVLDSVEALLEADTGKTVITSDHGNLLGDWVGPIPTRAYGHPHSLYTDALLEVPWLIIEGSRRRNIVSEPPIASNRATEDTVEDRLAHLGYVEESSENIGRSLRIVANCKSVV